MAHFYMKNTKGGSLANQIVDIESHPNFDGLKYCKCEGLLNKGKRKNVYTEKYADDDRLRIWQGENVTREATNVTFTFWFVGPNRQATYQNFYDYVKNGVISYWDDVRRKEAELVLLEATEPSEDVYIGSTPYIKADFKFQNLRGECWDSNGLK